jgi:Tol biopolymer transport system component
VGPRWSPDASRLAFTAQREDGRLQIFTLSEVGRKMDEITSESFHGLFYDWSPDGQSIVVNRIREHQPDGVNENSVLLLSARLGAETTARPVTAPRHDYLDEIRMSPNGRWLVFLGAKGGVGPGGADNATLYVVAVSGGPWIPITDGNSWDDKPRWSPDGKTIYFISARSGFLNVWGNRWMMSTSDEIVPNRCRVPRKSGLRFAA